MGLEALAQMSAHSDQTRQQIHVSISLGTASVAIATQTQTTVMLATHQLLTLQLLITNVADAAVHSHPLIGYSHNISPPHLAN